MLLLGLTGCAGFEQRMGWTEPPYLGDNNPEERPLSRLAFWRRHRAEETAPVPSEPALAGSGRSALMAGNAMSPADDEERPGLLRRLPVLGRLWRGGDDGSDMIDMPAPRYAPGPAASGTLAYASPRATANTTAFVPPRAPANPRAVAPSSAGTNPASDPAPATAASPPVHSEDEPLRELSADLATPRPQVDSSAIPVRNAGSSAYTGAPAAAPSPAEPAQPAPTGPGAESQQRATSAPPPVSPVAGDTPPVAKPGAQPGSTPDLPAASSAGTSAPSTATGGQPAPGTLPESGSWTTQPVVSTPGEVWPATGPLTYAGSAQALVATSSPSGYVPGGCEAPCGPKCKKHKLCPLKKHRQCEAVVLPSAQSVVSSCEATAPCKVKKPCFLKTWLHHKSGCRNKGCKGCKSCSYCGEPAPVVSVQGPIVSAQGPIVSPQ
jgi:hypothetical protein